MIEAIARLLQESNAQHMNLIIRPLGNGKVSVIAHTALQPTTAKESEKALQLRSALNAPIAISGDMGEIDVEFTEQLTQFADTFVEGAVTHSEITNMKAQVEQSAKAAAPKASQKQSEPKQENKTPEVEVNQFESDEADCL